MRNRTTLTLMELLVMILTFALAAALCLQLFGASAKLSRQIHQQNEAAIIAQNTAEQLKTGTLAAESFTHEGYLVQILPEETGILGLGQASILVSIDGETLFTLTAAWQEVE